MRRHPALEGRDGPWLLPAEQEQGRGDGGMECITLKLEVFPSPRPSISRLHHEDTAPPFYSSATLRQTSGLPRCLSLPVQNLKEMWV